MPPRPQQKRIGADSRDERRHACADAEPRLGVAKAISISRRTAPRAAGPSKDAVS